MVSYRITVSTMSLLFIQKIQMKAKMPKRTDGGSHLSSNGSHQWVKGEGMMETFCIGFL